jgi:hypothetical protein
LNLKIFWKGEFPSYWDISVWTAIHGDYLFSLNKISGKRKLYINNLNNKSCFELATSANVILGFNKYSIILGRLQDARSHINLNNIIAYDYINNELLWKNKDNYLYEKYKIPNINGNGYFNIGKSFLNLDTGKVETKSNQVNSENDFFLENIKIPLKRNWYQGAIGNFLCFFDQYYSIYLTDKEMNIKKIIILENLKKVSNKITGDFSFRNNKSLQNTTLFDAVINKDYIVWINSDNNLVIYSLKENLSRIIINPNKNLDLCLGSINKKYILIYGIENYNEGSIFVVDLGDTYEYTGEK